MRLLIQRVTLASVTINNKVNSHIGKGMLVLLGITHTDTETDVVKLVKKLLELRIFEDDAGKMNQSIQDVVGEIMIISQFTLYADCRRGRRPDFIQAANPVQAEKLYNQFIALTKQSGLSVKTGVFGAFMQIELVNDGPVTIMLDSQILQNKQ